MLTHIIHYTAADCISLHGLCRASFRDAVSFRQRLPRRAQNCALLAMTKSAGFAGKRNNFRNEKIQIRPGAAPQKFCRIIGGTPQKLRRIIGRAKEKKQKKKASVNGFTLAFGARGGI